MPGRKKVATSLSLVRYKGKTKKIIYEKYPDRESAEEASKHQFDAWLAGFKKYKMVRNIIASVISDVAPTLRAPYYGFGQKYFNLVVERRYDKNIVREYLLANCGVDKPGSLIDASKLNQVFDAIDRAYGIQ